MTDESRYFYDCPIKAAWMSKQFEMNIVGDCDGDWPVSDLLYFAHALYGEDQSPSDPVQVQRFYIRDDSLQLLEPQEGDLVAIDAFPGAFREHHENIVLFDAEGDPTDVRRIIQRNGIPFMTPEWEAA
jgi:hypothetical protein